MASPQLENGYTRIAHELLEKIAETKMNDAAKSIVLYVARQSYGNGEKFAVIDPGKLAEKLELSAQYARRLIRLLKTAVVIKEGVPPERSLARGERYLGISKDYTLWQWRSAYAHERAAERQSSLLDLDCGQPVDKSPNRLANSRAPQAREGNRLANSRAPQAREKIASPNRSSLVASKESSSSSLGIKETTTTLGAVADVLSTLKNRDGTPGLTEVEIEKHAARFCRNFRAPIEIALNYAQAAAQGGVRNLDSWIGSNLERRIERPAVKRDTRAARLAAALAVFDEPEPPGGSTPT